MEVHSGALYLIYKSPTNACVLHVFCFPCYIYVYSTCLFDVYDPVGQLDPLQVVTQVVTYMYCQYVQYYLYTTWYIYYGCCMFLGRGGWMLYVSWKRRVDVVCFLEEEGGCCMFLGRGGWMLYVSWKRRVNDVQVDRTLIHHWHWKRNHR